MNRQKLHLKAPDGWMNDPNGFIFYKGYYHVFYQYFPYGPRWGTMHWGHAVSKDLVEWEQKGIALFPTKREDQNGCFSGCAVEQDGKMHLIYTGVRYEAANPEDIHRHMNSRFVSAQMMIASEDGFTFDNWADKKVIIPPMTDSRIGNRTHTRDPKVWRGKDAWYMVLGSSTADEQGEILFYRSKDLDTWEYVRQVWKGPEFGWMWECPDYFKVEGGEVLILSAMGILENGGRKEDHSICFQVEFQEDSCEMKIPDTYQFLDYGMDLYAAQTTLDEAGRRVMMAWLRMPGKTEGGWIGMFCSPRVVEVVDGHIYFRMHPNISKAYSREITDAAQASPEGYKACFELEDGETVNVGGLLIYRKGSHICTDRTAVFASTCIGDYFAQSLRLICQTPEIHQGNQIEVLVDENMVEVFVNQGEYVITNAVYHLKRQITSSTPKEIRLYTTKEELP